MSAAKSVDIYCLAFLCYRAAKHKSWRCTRQLPVCAFLDENATVRGLWLADRLVLGPPACIHFKGNVADKRPTVLAGRIAIRVKEEEVERWAIVAARDHHPIEPLTELTAAGLATHLAGDFIAKAGLE